FIFPNEDYAAQCVSAILQNGLLPKCLEYMDEMCISALHKQKIDSILPKKAKAALLIEFDAHSIKEASNLLKNAALIAKENGIIKTILANNKQQKDKIWNARRLLSESVKQLTKFKISEDVVVPKTNIPLLVRKLRELGLKYDLTTCAFGHAGDGSLHVQILFNNWNDRHKVENLLKELFKITIDLGGTLTGEHGIGIAKQAFLNLEQSSEVILLQQQIKNVFDPEGRLNPGKFLPIDISESIKI
ncbi:MAG: FAD-linked oxidase, partial [bacterium]|nr:FAD-linked oxidase [bacterium]